MGKEAKKEDSQTRRSFLHSAAAVGAGLMFSPMISAQAKAEKVPDDINVALLGAGKEGQVLMSTCLKIPGIRFKAVCDIWANYNLKRTALVLKAYKHYVREYEDYKEMLETEGDLDAVIIATPDFWHSEHTTACLKAGLHVYCEKEMSNTLEGAKRMVQAARETGKLLQIGHQRRSNPRYIHCNEKLIKQAKLLGQITAVNGQWNTMMQEPLGWPVNASIPQAILNKYGYKSMEQFRNWRWYKGLGGGPIVDLGSHQIDIYNWFLDAVPTSVAALGMTNFYDKYFYEFPDSIMLLYEYETAIGRVLAFYQVITGNRNEAYYEKFLGNKATLKISENNWFEIYPETTSMDSRKWLKCIKNGDLNVSEKIMKVINENSIDELDRIFFVDESPPGFKLPEYEPMEFKLPITLSSQPYHQPHLENFFDAIRGKAQLNCPAEKGYETTVSVLKVNEAAEMQHKLEFKPEEFRV
jgi:predicted dehydrogenase